MGLNIKGIIKCALISLGVTAVILFILSLLAYFTTIGENTVTSLAYGAVILGALTGSVLVTLSARNKILWHTLSSCALYIIALLCVSFAVNGGVTFNTHAAAVVGGILLASLLGMVVAKRK